jgi:hypothetical protein
MDVVLTDEPAAAICVEASDLDVPCVGTSLKAAFP